MDILISWQQLWMMMLLILGGYYLIILFLYYRKELNGVLNGRYRFFSRLVDPGEDLQSGDSEPVSTSNKSKVKVDEATNLLIAILQTVIAGYLYAPLSKQRLIQSLSQAITHSAVDKEAVLKEPVNQFLKSEVPLFYRRFSIISE